MKNKNRFSIFASLLCLIFTFLFISQVCASTGIPLTHLHQSYFTNCMSNNEHAKIGNTEVESYVMGMGGESAATIQYEVNGKYDMFESLVGFSSSAPEGRICTFELWADGKMISKVGPLTSGTDADILRGSIKDAKLITLRMVPAKYNGTASAMWGNPKLLIGTDKEEFNNSLIVHINGELHQLTPNKINGEKNVAVPFPLKPGTHTYTIETTFDEEQGRAEITYIPINGQTGSLKEKAVKEKKNKSNFPQPVTIRREE